MECTAGAEHTAPAPLRTRLTGQELAGSPAVHDTPPVNGPERQRDAEAGALRQLLEQGNGPLNLVLGSLSGLEHKPTDENASAWPTDQRDRSALHAEGIEDGSRRDGVARRLGHARHPSDTT
jgi:hypothetical protein